MAKSVVQCGLNGVAGSNSGYFFRGDQFVEYDWSADRVAFGARTTTDYWPNPPLAFVLSAFDPSFGGALNGRDSGVAAYVDKQYLFRNDQYCRQPTGGAPPFVTDLDGSITAWGLKAPFNTGIDAAFSGKYSRAGKSYFFKGPNYARYDWGIDDIDYVKPISSLVGMPASFATGVDAAIDGDGAFSDYGYLFKDDQYVRFNWDPVGGNPHVDKGPQAIVGNWPGLAELLLAGEAKSKAFTWLWPTVAVLEAYKAALIGGTPFGDEGFVQGALNTHFKFPLGLTGAAMVAKLDRILPNYHAIVIALNRAPEIFRFQTPAENQAANPKFATVDADGNLKPTVAAYTFFSASINFTELYASKGQACRAAQIIHEATHFVDANNLRPNDIPEWYVTDAAADALGLSREMDIDVAEVAVRYDLMAEDIAVHNPSSYSSFAQQVVYRTDTRYGEARQDPIPGSW